MSSLRETGIWAWILQKASHAGHYEEEMVSTATITRALYLHLSLCWKGCPQEWLFIWYPSFWSEELKPMKLLCPSCMIVNCKQHHIFLSSKKGSKYISGSEDSEKTTWPFPCSCFLIIFIFFPQGIFLYIPKLGLCYLHMFLRLTRLFEHLYQLTSLNNCYMIPF